jgi:hypothetical protein
MTYWSPGRYRDLASTCRVEARSRGPLAGELLKIADEYEAMADSIEAGAAAVMVGREKSTAGPLVAILNRPPPSKACPASTASAVRLVTTRG